jgi:hypothetical protein
LCFCLSVLSLFSVVSCVFVSPPISIFTLL